MVEHVNITDPNLHEPKGAATATSGTVYQANGSGSGAWVQRRDTGWGFYEDGGAAQTVTTSPLKMSIDGTGSQNNISYLPSGISNLWDTTTDKITPGSIGDAYEIRLTFPVTGKSGSPTSLTFQLDISGLSSPTTMVTTRELEASFDTGSFVQFGFSVFTLSTFVTNGGQIFLTADTGSVEITNPSMLIIRLHKGS